MSLQIKCFYPYKDFVPDFYQTRMVDSKYVAEGIGNDIEEWVPRDPVLIDAPTGKGKNTFIIKECIPRAVREGGNVLILSNRVALLVQQKREIMKSVNSPLIERLTDKGVLETEDFGNVKVITYHRLYAFFHNPENETWIRNTRFVIVDECHFFVADSLFNESCGYYLDQLVWKFSHAVRIYLTATSWDVLYPIAEAERRKFHQFVKPHYYQLPRMCLRYYFPRSFAGYKLNFFGDVKDLLPLIESRRGEKWLIFIDNKEQGKKLESKLGSSCAYLDSEHKRDEVWDQIIKKQCFDKRILITTSVLDNGVNIVDPHLKNIVVFTDSRTSLIQMLGRKRCKDDEVVNVWVYDILYKKIQKYCRRYEDLYGWYELFDGCHDEADRQKLASRIWCSGNPTLYKLFGISRGRLFENKMARFAIERKLDFYHRILAGETTFQAEVQQWLDKPIEQPPRSVDKLKAFCDEHAGMRLSDIECEQIRCLINRAYEEEGFKEPQKSRLNDLKERALSRRLEALGLDFKIDCVKQQWVLIKMGEEGYDGLS